MEVENDGSIWYKVDVISNVLGKTIEEVKMFPMESLPLIYNDCVGLFLKQSYPVQAVKFKGKTYVMSLAFKRSVGEFVDLETAIKDGDMAKICSHIFREYEGDLDGKWENYSDDIEIIKTTTSESTQIDKLKKYDSKDNENPEVFGDFPVDLYRETMSFIIGIGMSFSAGTQNYSSTAELKSLLKKYKEIGDGLVTYSTLAKLTYSPSMEKVA